MHPKQTTQKTRIARILEQNYNLFGLEVLHESYSCTIDFSDVEGVEMGGAIRAQLERNGFSVTHEESTIYTLEWKGE